MSDSGVAEMSAVSHVTRANSEVRHGDRRHPDRQRIPAAKPVGGSPLPPPTGSPVAVQRPVHGPAPIREIRVIRGEGTGGERTADYADNADTHKTGKRPGFFRRRSGLCLT